MSSYYNSIDVNDMSCCGVNEIGNIRNHRNQQKTLDDLFKYYYSPEHQSTRCTKYNWTTGIHKFEEYTEEERCTVPAFLIFTDIGDFKRGNELQALIEKAALGGITKSEPRTNPNTSNQVTLWVWSIDRERFLELARAFLTPKPKKAKKTA